MGDKANTNCNDLLEAALHRIQALSLENAMLAQQTAGLYNTIDAQNKVIYQLTAENLDLNSQLQQHLTIVSLLEQNNENLSGQAAMQQQLIQELRASTQTDHLQMAKQQKDLDKIRHSRALLVKDKYGRKSEKSLDPVTEINLKGIGLTEQERLEAEAYFLQHKHVKIEKLPTPDILEQGLPVKTIIMEGPKGSIYLGESTVYKLVRHEAWMELHKIVRHVYLEKAADFGKFKNITVPLPGMKTKCIADPTVIAQILADKYLYHLPLQRQQKRYEREGVQIPYSTLCDWISYGARTLKPLWELLMIEAVKYRLLHCDETTLKVIDKAKEGNSKLHRGYMWVMLNHVQNFVVFKYAKGRGHIDIDEVLKDFSGYLHTDGYGAYDKYGGSSNVKHAKCMSHCRRYFKNAENTSPKIAKYALVKFFAPLYAIEERCRQEHMEWEQIEQARQKYAVPILQAFQRWLLFQQAKVKPDTPIAKAVNYILKRWEGVTLYTQEGCYLIDNNSVERMIRDLAISRKNWLFAGSHKSAANAAIIFSLFGTCKLQGIKPQEWLCDVLGRIDSHPKDKLSQLLPQNWKPAKTQAA